jgi:hypothetical protein
MMLSKFAILLIAFVGSTQFLGAQSSTPGAYKRFARAIQNKADSAASVFATMNVSRLNAMDDQVSTDQSESNVAEVRQSAAQMLQSAAQRVSRLTGDFDATTPPDDFVRLQQQMVEPLKDFGARLTHIAKLYSVSCAPLVNTGVSCNEGELRAQASTQALLEMRNIMEPIATYAEVRERAQRMLKEHNVYLPSVGSAGASGH